MSEMTDKNCKHEEINLVRTELIHFCPPCGSTICQVTGAVRNRHGKVSGNVGQPDWKPGPNHEKEVLLKQVFDRLDILAKGELDKAQELLTMVKEMAPHSSIDRDLDSLSGLAYKAMLRQRVGHAYVWAKQDIKAALNLDTTDAEDSYACHNHPTERN